jgi:hypothetical protein
VPPKRSLLLLGVALLALQFAGGLTSSADARGTRGARDRDHDGLTDRFERHRSHTRVRRRDTDRDRLRDGWEVRHRTNPRRVDTDRDGLWDGYEVKRAHTDPRSRDTDGDGLTDLRELMHGSDPLDAAEPARAVRSPRDTTPPDSSITSGPSGSVASASASFSFSGSDDVTRASKLRFECRLDASAWVACSSPKSFSSLADGSHTFDVRAKDATGNLDPTPATRSWTVETVTAAFTYSPTSPFAGQPAAFDARASRCVAAPCQFQWVDVGSDGPGGIDWPLGSGQTMDYAFQTAGTKHVRLTVTDARGAYSAVEHDVVVDQPFDILAPDTAISDSPPATTTSTSASFTFASTEAGSSFECRLDGSAWSACSSPKSYGALAPGQHTFEVRATDAAGNVDATPASRTWTILSDVAASFSFSPSSPLTGQDVTFDAGNSACIVGPCVYDWVDLGADGPGGADWPLGYDQTLHFTFQQAGIKYVQLTVTDATGATDSVEHDVTVAASPSADTSPPDTTINSGPSGTVSSPSASFSFASTEPGSTFECRLDGSAWTSCSSPKTYSSLATGSHIFDVRATDSAGNVDTSPASRMWTVSVTTTACFASPSACGYPDGTNSGVPAGTALTSSGSMTVTTPGAVINGRDIAGAVYVAANNVTIRNSRITASGGSGTFAVSVKDGVGGLTIEDTEIRGAGTSAGQEVESAIRLLGGAGVTVRRSHLYNCGHCIISYSPVSITDSFIKVTATGGSYHYEDIYICGTSVNANHNTLYNPQPQTATVFGDTICGSNSFTVTNNLLAGGGFMMYPQANSSSQMGSMSVTGNRFARCLGAPVYNSGSGGTTCQGLSTTQDDGHGYYPYGGYFGLASYIYSGSGHVWSDNKWDDNLQTVCPNRSAGCL